MTGAGDDTPRPMSILCASHTPTLVREYDQSGDLVDEYLSAVHRSPQGLRVEADLTAMFGSGDGNAQTLTTRQLAHFLGIHPRTVRRMVDDGQIPYLTIRSQHRFHLPDVINALTTGGPRAQKTKRLSPRPARGFVPEERNRTALLEHPEDGRWADDLCSAGHDAQGRGHHPVPRGDDRGWTRISVRRPLGEEK